MQQVLLNIIISGFLYLLLAQSFSIIFLTTKFFHIAHAAIISFGAYFTFFFFQKCSLSLWVAIPFSILISILLGLLIELVIYKPLRKKKTPSLLILIASLGLYVFLQNLISLFWGDDTKNLRSGDIKIGYNIFEARITSIQISLIFISAILFVLVSVFLKFHKVGKNIRAVSANIELADILGINSENIILWTFGIGSGMAAFVGILVASDTGLTPTMGFNLLLYGTVVMIIGGVGSNWGLIGGAFLLATAQHLTTYYMDSKWIDVVTYTILILFLIWKPLGFSGTRFKKVEI